VGVVGSIQRWRQSGTLGSAGNGGSSVARRGDCLGGLDLRDPLTMRYDRHGRCGYPTTHLPHHWHEPHAPIRQRNQSNVLARPEEEASGRLLLPKLCLTRAYSSAFQRTPDYSNIGVRAGKHGLSEQPRLLVSRLPAGPGDSPSSQLTMPRQSSSMQGHSWNVRGPNVFPLAGDATSWLHKPS
jgi:hypothetical protein